MGSGRITVARAAPVRCFRAEAYPRHARLRHVGAGIDVLPLTSTPRRACACVRHRDHMLPRREIGVAVQGRCGDRSASGQARIRRVCRHERGAPGPAPPAPIRVYRYRLPAPTPPSARRRDERHGCACKHSATRILFSAPRIRRRGRTISESRGQRPHRPARARDERIQDVPAPRGRASACSRRNDQTR